MSLLVPHLAEYARSVCSKLQFAYRSHQEHQEHAHAQQKAQYNKKVKHASYSVGDLVWLSDPAHSRDKPAPHWKGPYIVTQTVKPIGVPVILYSIQPKNGPEKTLQVMQYNSLKPYLSPIYLLEQLVDDAPSLVALAVVRDASSIAPNISPSAPVVIDDLPSITFSKGAFHQRSDRPLLLDQPQQNIVHCPFIVFLYQFH